MASCSLEQQSIKAGGSSVRLPAIRTVDADGGLAGRREKEVNEIILLITLYPLSVILSKRYFTLKHLSMLVFDPRTAWSPSNYIRVSPRGFHEGSLYHLGFIHSLSLLSLNLKY